MASDPTGNAAPSSCIGIFDSGVGGLSVLRAIRHAVPSARLHYVADSACAPYGERRDDEVLDRSRRIVSYLLAHGAGLIVVACNTATAVAIDDLRREHPHTRFVGVEPGVRPAIALSPRRRIAVMATEATLRSVRFRALVQREAAGGHVHAQPCRGLATAIERGATADAELHTLIERYAGAARAADVEVVALGCTHYPFVRRDIAQALGPDIAIVDTSDAVATQVARLWPAVGASDSAASCLLETTGDPERLEDFVSRWLDFEATVAARSLAL